MREPKIPREILYVQKLHYFTFLCSVILVAALPAALFRFTWGLTILLLGILAAGGLTLRKQQFLTPTRESVVRRLAKSFSAPRLTPRDAAVAATQIYYQLGDFELAEALLHSYLPEDDLFIKTTLADIYLHQGKTSEALQCLRSLKHLENPIVHWTFGRLFLAKKDYAKALHHLERATKCISTGRGPLSGAGLLNSLFMSWSIKLSLLHSLVDCYHKLGRAEQAQAVLRRGKLRVYGVLVSITNKF